MKCACILLMAVVAHPAVGGSTVEVDLRSETGAGRWVWFSMASTSSGERAEWLMVAAAPAPADEVASAFGLWRRDGEDRVGAVDSSRVSQLRDDGRTLAVHLDPGVWEEVVALVERWERRAYEQPPERELLNLTERLVVLVGLARPYRSALSPDNATGYFSDLLVLNRRRD